VLAPFRGAVEFDEFTQSLPWADPCRCSKTRAVRRPSPTCAQAAAGNFKPHDKATLNAGYSRSVFWLKIDLQYRPNPRRNAPGCWSWRIRRWITSTSTCRCQRRLSPGRRTGDALPFASREIRQNNYLFS
jgi:hypothetical protein